MGSEICIRDRPCSTENIASVIVELLERPTLNGIFHWAGNEIISRFDLGVKILERFGFDPSRITPINLEANFHKNSQRPKRLVFELSPLINKVKTLPATLDQQMEALKVPDYLYGWYRENADDPSKYILRI